MQNESHARLKNITDWYLLVTFSGLTFIPFQIYSLFIFCTFPVWHFLTLLADNTQKGSVWIQISKTCFAWIYCTTWTSLSAQSVCLVPLSYSHLKPWLRGLLNSPCGPFGITVCHSIYTFYWKFLPILKCTCINVTMWLLSFFFRFIKQKWCLFFVCSVFPLEVTKALRTIIQYFPMLKDECRGSVSIF